jgi:hypothetical protein
MRAALVLALAVLAACAKKSEPPPEQPPVPRLAPEEVQRAKDACADYLQKVCACAEKLPAVKNQCDLARALPDAVRLGLEVSVSPDSQRADVMGAQKAIRQAVRECVEGTAKLPSLGCQ